MTTWARTYEQDDLVVVAEITTTDPAGRFHESLTWSKVPSAVEAGWQSADNGDTFTPAPSRTLSIDDMRELRNGVLAASDWTQLPDAPVDPAEWATYRQELRDLPAAFDSGTDVVWPEPPDDVPV